MATNQSKLGGIDQAVSSLPQPGPPELLLSTAAGGAVTLTANIGDNASSIVSVQNAKRVTLWIYGNPGAANAVAQIVPLISAESAQPALGDDSWFGIGVPDAAPTDTALAGTLPAGADYTITPNWGFIKARPLVITTLVATAGTDQIRMAVTLDVSHARWMYVAAKQITAAMTLLIKWSVCL